MRAEKVGWLAIPKNKLTTVHHNPKPDLEHGSPLCCTMAKRPLPTMPQRQQQQHPQLLEWQWLQQRQQLQPLRPPRPPGNSLPFMRKQKWIMLHARPLSSTIHIQPTQMFTYWHGSSMIWFIIVGYYKQGVIFAIRATATSDFWGSQQPTFLP